MDLVERWLSIREVLGSNLAADCSDKFLQIHVKQMPGCTLNVGPGRPLATAFPVLYPDLSHRYLEVINKFII